MNVSLSIKIKLKTGRSLLSRIGKTVTIVLLMGHTPVACQTQTNLLSKLQRPRLVVGIVVDQMRWDYLYRYYNHYGQYGFKRLLNDGFTCENTLINYLPSATAVGHTTIFTGSVPSIDGIAGNEWIDQLSERKWYCTEDTIEQTVGSNSAAGKMSPRNLLVSTITDELRLSTNFQSQVVGVSLKDRAAIFPVGHTATAAFWMDDATGRFITSTYYMKQLPAWVNHFNEQEPGEQLLKNGWNTLYPVQTYTQSTEDNAPWEGSLGGKLTPVFPYDIFGKYKKTRSIIRQTPFGNTLTLNFAEAAIDGYHLGQKNTTDFLTINCASTDYVGHMFGPNSIEEEDVFLRLDKDLATFFSFLDQKIGKGNYLLFLTADHGGAHSLGFMQEHHIPGELWETDSMVTRLNDLLNKKFGVSDLAISGITAVDYQINYDMNKVNDNHLDIEAIKKISVAFLQKQAGVMYAVDVTHIGEVPVPKRIKEMIINGYNYKRSGAIQIATEPGWLPQYSKKGTTHGAWNPYDTHIPLIFMGWKIKSGHSNRTIDMTDITPTLAALLHIQMPNGCIGTPIQEITQQIK